MHIYTYTCIIITTRQSFRKIYTSHFIERVRKGFSRFYCERELKTEQNCNILTPLLWPSAFCLSRSPDAQPEARGLSFLLSAGFLYHILSPTGLQFNRGSQGPLLPGGGFLYHILSLTSLISNSLTSCPHRVI